MVVQAFVASRNKTCVLMMAEKDKWGAMHAREEQHRIAR